MSAHQESRWMSKTEKTCANDGPLMGHHVGHAMAPSHERARNAHEHIHVSRAEHSGCPALSNGIMHARTPNVNRMPFETD